MSVTNIVKFVRSKVKQEPEENRDFEELGEDEVYRFVLDDNHAFEISFTEEGLVLSKACIVEHDCTALGITVLDKATLLLD